MRIRRVLLLLLASLVISSMAGNPSAAAASRGPHIPEVRAAEYDENAGIDASALTAAACVDPESPECSTARALLMSDLVDEIEALPADGSEELMAIARTALEVDDADVQEAALLLLSRTSGTLTLGREMIPVLTSDRPRLRQIAAALLPRCESADFQRLGQLFSGRQSSSEWAESNEIDAPPNIAALGFKPYPDASRFALAEWNGSVAVLTTDAVAEAIAFYRVADQEPLEPIEFFAEAGMGQDDRDTEAEDAAREKKMAEIQKKMEAAAAKGDYTAIAKISEELQAAISGTIAKMQAALGIQGQIPANLQIPGVLPESARFVVLRREKKRATRVVLVYPEAALGQTMIWYMWLTEAE